MSTPYAIRQALKTIPQKQTRPSPPDQFLRIDCGDDSQRTIVRAIRALGAELHKRGVASYSHLQKPKEFKIHQRFGPLRFLKCYIPFPSDGGMPGYRCRMDVAFRARKRPAEKSA